MVSESSLCSVASRMRYVSACAFSSSEKIAGMVTINGCFDFFFKSAEEGDFDEKTL